MFKLFLYVAIVADVFSVVLTTADISPSKCKGENEVYCYCINRGCEARNCSQFGYPVACKDCDPDDCIEGCVCKSGYLRSDKGKCIPEKHCPTCGGDTNAEPGCGTFCDRCSNYNEPHGCPASCRSNGCQCKTGYIYDQNTKKCVLPEQCTPTCKEGEVYSNCTNGGCDPRNCSQLGYPVPCVKLSPDACIKGCVCASGYLRADNGTCIPANQCPTCGGDPNAEPGCGVFCDRCSNYNKPHGCPAIPTSCSSNTCQCKTGYIYDQNTKKCVLPEQCTPTCKVNEVYSNCTNSGCDARNCSQLGYPVPCVDLDPGACIKGCVCAAGYLRADNGTCIPVEQCPSCGGDYNAELGCGTFCERCSNYKTGPGACSDVCQINGCQCRKGYVYDDNLEKCVLPNHCTPTCKDNEVYSNCTNSGCDAKNCSQLGYPVPCVKLDPDECIKGCVCASGYLRADNGTCIPVKQCPSCGGDCNAESGCGTFCDRCSGPIPCPKICKVNACQCKTGYIYDQNIEKCVLPKQCTPTCKSHEVYSDCVNGGCQARNCSQYGKPVPCVLVVKGGCINGCVCESGYLRADNGTCIPEYQCPKCKSGEVYSKCANGVCPPQLCSRYGQPQPQCSPIHPDACKPGCICTNNYLRNDDGVCIPQEQCPVKCKSGEVYSKCANNLSVTCPPQLCSWIGKPPPFCPYFNSSSCKPGCTCKDNYLRNNSGVCIPKEQCPENCECGEVYSECANQLCPPQLCSWIGKPPPPCAPPNPDSCEPGCICADNYLRNGSGVCIPKEQCPENCKCDELYSECANQLCPPQLCSLKGQPVPPCAPPNPETCEPGCICANNYLRNDNGTCIPEDKCPEACNHDDDDI